MILRGCVVFPSSPAPLGRNVSPDLSLMDGMNEVGDGICCGDGLELSTASYPEERSGELRMDDLALVAAVLRKDRKATAEFVSTYTDTVYSFVRRRLNPRQDLVDDLVQDVFIASWENLGRFRGSSSLRGWLLGIARHKVEDHYRRLLQDAETLDAELAEILPDSRLDVEAAADRERIERQARKVLNEMPQHYSVALLWRYWERRSAREVAQATGRSEKAVERLLARAREQFRRRWPNE